MTEDPIIQEILSAKTHYEVLGVDTNTGAELDAAALRKAYLKRSVKVHPDKNADPAAKEAFQKVAQAWQVLSDDSSRRQYDAALRSGRANMNDDYCYDSKNTSSNTANDDYRAPRPETYYAGPPPSMQESLFLFATVVGGMMGGKNVTNLSEALYWGEKLMRQADGTARGTDAEMTAQEKATVAMAFGSGLKVAGNAARAFGFNGAAEKMEQTARLAQLAGVGVMVAEQPAVKAALQQGGEHLRKLKGGIDVIRSVLNQQQNEQQQGRNNNHYNSDGRY